MFGFPPGGGFGGGGFEGHYRVHSIAYMENKAHLENGDKILLPPSALDRLGTREEEEEERHVNEISHSRARAVCVGV